MLQILRKQGTILLIPTQNILCKLLVSVRTKTTPVALSQLAQDFAARGVA